jgi:hypothetical protein
MYRIRVKRTYNAHPGLCKAEGHATSSTEQIHADRLTGGKITQ